MTKIKTLSAIIMVLSMIVGATIPVSAQRSCGYKPYKPYPPYGCKDLKARCVITVNADGTVTATWVWDCVPN